MQTSSDFYILRELQRERELLDRTQSAMQANGRFDTSMLSLCPSPSCLLRQNVSNKSVPSHTKQQLETLSVFQQNHET